MEKTFLLGVDKHLKGSSLEMANHFYEREYFHYTDANIFHYDLEHGHVPLKY